MPPMMMMAPTATMDRYETCASLTLTSKSRLFGTEHFAVQDLNRIHVIVGYMSCAVASVGCRYRVLDCFHMPDRGRDSLEERAGCRSSSEIVVRKGDTIQADPNQP